MTRDDILFIKSALPQGRTVYYDFPDRFALILLEQYLGERRLPVAELKRGPLARLLARPTVRDLLARHGRSDLGAEDLLNAWPTDPFGYRLSLGTWPELDETPDIRWHQVTRKGWSLALQLNLSESHRNELTRFIPDWQELFRYPWHAQARSPELTLAWARIDLDFDTGEALIEEIQSDWIRYVKDSIQWGDYRGPKEAWAAYAQEVMLPEVRDWSETMMTATLWFLLHELGLRTIFYHTHRSGTVLKRIEGIPPPRSLYTQLPRKFCFQTTHNGPRFIRDCRQRGLSRVFTDPETTWYIHDFAAPQTA